MNIMAALAPFILSWKDLVEILFFSLSFYYLSLWLYQDKQKKLLRYFYGYCALTLVSHMAGLSTINAVLFLFSPVIIIGFLLMHQTMLQKNMVSLKNIPATKQTHNDWLSNIMRLSITMLHNNKELFLVIEQSDSIATHLTSEYEINAAATNDLLFMLVSHIYKPTQMLWIQTDGTVRGVNSQWKTSWGQQGSSNDWIDDALAYTSKNDALLLHVNGHKDSCDLIFDGTIEKELTIDQAHQLIRKQIGYPLSTNQKGYYHD